MFDFADPWLFVLLPLPLLAYVFLSAGDERGAALIVPESVGQKILYRSRLGDGGIGWRYILLVPVWLLLIIALCGPRQLIGTPALPVSGRDLVFAIDLSGSMVRKDFTVDGETTTRLDAVKKVAAEFVRGRGGDRVGLVVFGSEAYFATPLTYDVEAVAQAIETAVIGISGRATNISDALGITLKRFADSKAKSRVVILLSDGANNAGAANPRGVAKLAHDMGVRVHTIALGPKDLANAPDERGVVDVATLQAMSDLSSGKLFRVKTSEDLEKVASDLDALEATVSAGLAAEIYRELWLYPAIIAIFGCLGIVLRGAK